MKTFFSHGLPLLASLAFACGGEAPAPQSPPAPPPSKAEPQPVASSKPTTPPPGPKLTMPEMQKKTLLATLNERNPEKLFVLYAPDAVKRMPAADGWKEIRGAEAIVQRMDDINWKAGPTVTWTRARVVQKNEFTVTEYIVSGTKDEKK